MITARPYFSAMERNNAVIVLVLPVSKFPVGSSAKISGWIVGQRQRRGDALLFATAKFLGSFVA